MIEATGLKNKAEYVSSGNQPLLTVVMPVYNGEKYLKEAIDSVLNQTFRDFDFLIINDGSTDKSFDIINTYNDRRIKLVKNERNRGIAYCRNVGLQLAKGEFLAWFDCDDINELTRFEKQINFLRNNEQYAICGTWLTRFGGEKEFVAKVSGDPEVVKAKLLFKTSILNATSMWRISKIRQFNLLFNEDLPITEDYDFYARCSMLFPMSNLRESLYLYRASETSIMKSYASKEKEEEYFNIHNIVYATGLKNLGITPSNADLRIHGLIASDKLFDNIKDYKESFKWLKNIKENNNHKKLYRTKALNKVLGEEFFFISKKASQLGIRILIFYIVNCSRNFRYVAPFDILKLAVRCVIRYKKF